AIVMALRPTVFDREVPALDIAAFAEALAKCSHHWRVRTGRRAVEKPNYRHRRLLPVCDQRPRHRRAAEKRDELAPSQVEHCGYLPRWQRHHTPATGCLGSVGLPHLQLADGSLSRLWGRPELS